MIRRTRDASLIAAACTLLCIAAGPSLLAHEGIDSQIAALTARLRGSPHDADLHLRRGELHRIQGEWSAAEADYASARRLDPSLAVADLCLASMRLDQGRPREALGAIDRYIQSRPADPAGLIVRARARAATGDSLAAASDYARALSLFPPGRTAPPEYYLEGARALADSGQTHLDEAIAVLDAGIEKLGRPVTLQLLAIDLEQQAGRWEAALRRLDAAASNSSRREVWLERRGRILERAGRPEEASLAYREALQAVRSVPPARRRGRMIADLEASLEAATRRLEEASR